MNKIPFSVLMSVHQRDDIEKSIEKVVDSIYQNTLLPEIFLLMIDGPIKNSFFTKIITLQKKYNFKVYKNSTNIGLSKIMNKGLKKLNTKWIIRSDGDDISHNTRFEKIIENINDEISIISSYVNEFDEFQNKLVKETPLSHQQIKKFMKFRNPINHNAVAFNRLHALSVGGYPDLYLKEDYGLWIKMISKGYIAKNIPLALVDAYFDTQTFKRRGGLKNIKSDFFLTNLLYQNKIINFYEYLLNLIIRLLFSIMPIILLKIIYKKLFRKF